MCVAMVRLSGACALSFVILCVSGAVHAQEAREGEPTARDSRGDGAGTGMFLEALGKQDSGGGDSDSETRSEVGAESETRSEVGAESEARSEVGAETEARSEVEAETRSEVGAEAEARSEVGAETEGGAAPKVAVVVAGDPDERLRRFCAARR